MSPPTTEMHAPLLSPESVADLRRMAEGQRWPRVKLTHLSLDLCEAERAVHVAQVAGNADEATAAEWHRTAVRADLQAEQEAVADVFLSSLSHAIEHKPQEVADLMATVFASPTVRAALVPALESILKPTVEWLRGELRDLGGRVQDIEHAVTELGVLA